MSFSRFCKCRLSKWKSGATFDRVFVTWCLSSARYTDRFVGFLHKVIIVKGVCVTASCEVRICSAWVYIALYDIYICTINMTCDLPATTFAKRHVPVRSLGCLGFIYLFLMAFRWLVDSKKKNNKNLFTIQNVLTLVAQMDLCGFESQAYCEQICQLLEMKTWWIKE